MEENNLILDNDTIRSLDSIEEKYGQEMREFIMNRFFIDSGMLPSMPIYMHPGQFKSKLGVWIPGVRFSQQFNWTSYYKKYLQNF